MFNPIAKTPSYYSDYFRFRPRNPNLGRSINDNFFTLKKQLQEYKKRIQKPINTYKPVSYKVFTRPRLKTVI